MEISMENSRKISRENSQEKCPECGKKVKFLKKHIKRSHSPGKKVEKRGKISRKKRENFQENFQENHVEKRGKISSAFFKEISLKEEFEKMTDTINPKKEKSEEPKYKCAACEGTFNERIKRCPHCGVEFE